METMRAKWISGLAAAAVLAVAPCRTAGETAPSPRIRPVEERVLASLQEARGGAGAAPLERRPALDAVARARAERVAGLPDRRRMSDPWLLEDALGDAEVVGWARAFQRMSVLTGNRLAERIAEQWRALPEAWSHALDGGTRGIGLAGATGADGAYVFVAVLVEDLDAPADPAAVEREVLAAVNAIRREHGLVELDPDAALGRVARAYSEDMRDRGFFDHRDPDGRRAADRVAARGVPFRRIAENLGRVDRAREPADRAVRNWMDSPGHRANILDPGLLRTGVGVAVSPAGAVWFTQLFVEPAEPASPRRRREPGGP